MAPKRKRTENTNDPPGGFVTGDVPTEPTTTTAVEYLPTRDEWVKKYRLEGRRRFTEFSEGFEACTIYDAELSMGEGDEYASPLDFVKWRQGTRYVDWRECIGRNKFTKYREYVPFNYDAAKKDDLYMWWYDADYSMWQGSVTVNLYGVTEEGTSIMVRLLGYNPYMYVGIPDTWVDWCRGNGADTEEKLKSALENMVRDLHRHLESTLREVHSDNYKFKDIKNVGFLCPLPGVGDVIEDGLDVLGACGDAHTYMFKLETTHPQVITAARDMLWNPYGGRGPYGIAISQWLFDCNAPPPLNETEQQREYRLERSMPKPEGVTAIARSDRMWLKEKEKQCKKENIPFEPIHYRDHPERALFNSFYKPNHFGTDARFSVYECNVDFIVRYISDQQNLVGWCKIQNWQLVPRSQMVSMMDVEILINYMDIKHLPDTDQVVDKNPKTKEYVRELTQDEQTALRLYEKPPKIMIGSFDAEMLSRFPNFPNARFCPIMAWGVRAFNKCTNEFRNYYFCLSDKPPWATKYEEYQCFYGKMYVYEKTKDDIFFYYVNESDMLKDICLFYAEMRFHKHIGWNSNGFDIPYFIRRCQSLGLPEAMNFMQMVHNRTTKWEYNFIKTNRTPSINVIGTVPIDLMLYVRADLSKNSWRSHSLNYASMKLLGKPKVELSYAFLELCQMTSPATRELIYVYLEGDISLPHGIFDIDKVFDSLCSFTEVQYCTFQHLVSKGAQLKVYAGILGKFEKVAREKNRPVKLPWHPRKSKEESYEKYQGAHVFPPEVGFYDDDCPVATLDYSSLYPSEMCKQNMCYSTLVTPWAIEKYGLEEGRDYWRCPDFHISHAGELIIKENPHNPAFVKEHVFAGFIPVLEMELKKFRNVVKGIMETAEKDGTTLELELGNCESQLRTASEEERDALVEKINSIKERMAYSKNIFSKANKLQNAIKVYMNSIYGFVGATDSLAPLRCAATSITTMGQIDIKRAQMFMENECTVAKGYPGNAHIIYGDTDSIMFILRDWTTKPNRPEFMAVAKHFAGRITNELFQGKLKIEFEKIYVRYDLMKKKRYAGLKFEESYSVIPDYKGVKPKRKDSMPFLDRAFKSIIENCIERRNPDAAIEYVGEILEKIASGEESLNELKCSCSLSKDLANAYVPGTDGRIHITKGMAIATKQYKRTGRDSFAGDRFNFVLRKQKSHTTKKKEEESKTARLEDPDYMFDNKIEYDPDYYIESMITNMGQALENMVPGGMRELRARWLNRPGMRKRKRNISSNSALGKLACKRVKHHCSCCNKPMFSITDATSLNAYHDNIQKNHIILQFEGEEQKEVKITQDIPGGVCHECRHNPSHKFYAYQRMEDARYFMVKAWNACQKCPSRDMGGDIILQCTNNDCNNYYIRRETIQKYEAAHKFASLFDW